MIKACRECPYQNTCENKKMEAVVPLQNTKWILDLAEKISEKMMHNA